MVIAGAAFAVTAARTRRRLVADQAHFALLRGAAEIADSVVTIPEVVERVGNLLVPSFADVCVIDVLRGGRVERLGVVASRPDAEAIEDRLRRRDPGTPEDVQTGAPLLAEHVDEAHLRANARDEADYQFLRSLAERSHIRVPLRSRGNSIGTLSLLAITRSYSAADLQLSQLLAGRVGLALDNAGLFAELETAQVQLTTALDTLAEAITIQNEHGTLVYANDAAGASLGFESGAQLVATPLREITDAYESFHEDGSPLRMDRLPGRQVLEGQTPEPLLVRAVNKRTGDERWRMVKATAVPVREGQPRLAVNVIEDVTEVKRAELAPALPRRGERRAVVGARLRGDAEAGRRAGGPAAGRLVRGDDARRGRAAALGGRRAQRSGQGGVRARLRAALPDRRRTRRPARRRSSATAARS